MKNLHIVTPCSRPGWLIPAMKSIGEWLPEYGLSIHWTLLVNINERKLFSDIWTLKDISLFESSINESGSSIVGVKKLNEFMSRSIIDPETWIWIMSDDNLLPINVLKSINRALIGTDKEIVVTSHKRGQRADGHDCYDFIAKPECMQMCQVSGEQIFFKRKYWKSWSERDNMGDGQFIEQLYREFPDKFLFLPEVWTTFDAQKASRWDADKVREIVFEKGGVNL